MDKLSYFIKEAQRLDGFASTNFNQMAYEDIEVDGIKILKRTCIIYVSQSLQVNPS